MSHDEPLNAHSLGDGEFAWKGSEVPILRDMPQPLPAARSAGTPPPMPAGWIPPTQGPSPVRRSYERMNRWLGSFVHRVTLPEDAAPADPLSKLVVSTPPWMISLIVHFSFMILLGLIALEAHHLATKADPVIEVDLSKPKDEIYADRLGEQLDDPSIPFSSEGLEPSKDAVAALSSSDLPEVESPLIGPPVLDPTGDTGTMPTGTVATPAIGLEFSGREEGIKKALLKAYGGTALTEDAVKEGLRWLARQQKPKGMWSLQGPYRGGTTVENEEAATAMALLAFQAAGHTPKYSERSEDSYARVVARAWKALLRSQQKDGQFFNNRIAEQHQLYTQAMCTIALCELYGMTRDDEYRDPAQKAVDYCVKIQASEGGWRYQPGIDADMSVTGWFAMALQSARMAGLEVPSQTFAGITKFLNSVEREEGSRYAYQPLAGATLPLSAEGLLCRQYLGWNREDPRLRGGVDYILANLPAWDKRNMYYWYYATQVCHHMEGEDWQKWNAVMRKLLPENQEKNGAERGSWNPAGDRWGDSGGRLYVTCLSLYTLEVYYRHLPIYRHGMLAQ